MTPLDRRAFLQLTAAAGCAALELNIYVLATDPNLAANYDSGRLEQRPENKLALQREANLREDVEVPLIGLISRLTDSKGFDILGQAIDHIQEAVAGSDEQDQASEVS